MTGKPWRPQIKLLHFFMLITAFSGVFALLISDFAGKVMTSYALAIIGFSLVATGILYARDLRRAFFIGAVFPLIAWIYCMEFTRVHQDYYLLYLPLVVVSGAACMGLAWWLTREASGE